MKTFAAFVEYDPVTKLYVGIVPGLPGAHTQGATLDELETNLKEVIGLCLEELGKTFDPATMPRVIGVQNVEVEA